MRASRSCEFWQKKANLESIGDPIAKDSWGDTPTERFYLDRDHYCTIIRPPFEEEEDAWWDLMGSVCRQHGIDFDTFEPRWQSEYVVRRRQRVVEVLLNDNHDGDEDEEDDNDDGAEDNKDEGDDAAGGSNSTGSLHEQPDEGEEFANAVETQP